MERGRSAGWSGKWLLSALFDHPGRRTRDVPNDRFRREPRWHSGRLSADHGPRVSARGERHRARVAVGLAPGSVRSALFEPGLGNAWCGVIAAGADRRWHRVAADDAVSDRVLPRAWRDRRGCADHLCRSLLRRDLGDSRHDDAAWNRGHDPHHRCGGGCQHCGVRTHQRRVPCGQDAEGVDLRWLLARFPNNSGRERRHVDHCWRAVRRVAVQR